MDKKQSMGFIDEIFNFFYEGAVRIKRAISDFLCDVFYDDADNDNVVELEEFSPPAKSVRQTDESTDRESGGANENRDENRDESDVRSCTSEESFEMVDLDADENTEED